MLTKFIKKLIEKFAPKVKEEIDELIITAIERLKIKVGNYDYEVKINALVEYVMSKVKLPLVLKPFKGVVKNVVKDVAEKVAEDLIKDFSEYLFEKETITGDEFMELLNRKSPENE